VPSGRVPYRSDSPLYTAADAPFDADDLGDEPPLLVEKLDSN
jgi:5'-nucleotidase